MAFLPRLKDLHIARNGIGTMGAVFIAKEMKDGNAQELEWLSMGNNLIGDMGTQALSIVLEMCPRLEWLDLPQNSISDVGAMALGKAVEYLGRKLSLRELDLRGNQISPFGQESLETGKLELPELQFWLAALPGEPGSLAVQAMPEPSNDVDTVHRVVLGNSWSITADY
ncbi:unnamed protein product [Polarella glacialis]|uniref:Uncharacterized protein n=1 Tax=Polarella glacialis TaxID=89957 RepID=A0A813JP56_POLGL|nr:unnamed protein product [Polarella glacialis]